MPEMPAAYLPLHKYLDGRYAETVVLALTQIEDLIGVGLPPEAHTSAAWWSNDGTDGTTTPQARSWTQANRTASPNLGAHNVMFVRHA